MKTDWLERLLNLLLAWGLDESVAKILRALFLFILVILLAYLANFITKRIIVATVTRLIKKTKIRWDDIFIEKKVFNNLSHFAPALVIYYLAPVALGDYPSILLPFFVGAAEVYMVVVGLLFIDSFINALHLVYQTFPIAKTRHISGYVQVVKIFFYFIAILLIMSIVFNVHLKSLFTGLGALAAVLLLVFKDTILGFVASIQLSANEMVKTGDWITMESHHADGTVMEINLNTVKVQNWDKTIATIPTYALVSKSFHNWKGMEESGGRRIKRSINIDMKSVNFCTPEMLTKFKKITILKDYVENKEKELEEYNKKNQVDESVLVNGRRLTNLGTFRKYIEFYLKAHPKIHDDMTFLVRHLHPTEKGIPIEIYVFSNDQAWANYESIQADIFDHILAVIPEFNLRVFQNPTGDDFQKMLN